MSIYNYAPDLKRCDKCGTQYLDPKREECPHKDPDYVVPGWVGSLPGKATGEGGEP